MTQDIIVYIIIAVCGLLVLWGIYRRIRGRPGGRSGCGCSGGSVSTRRKDSSCGGCSGCS